MRQYTMEDYLLVADLAHQLRQRGAGGDHRSIIGCDRDPFILVEAVESVREIDDLVRLGHR